MKKHKKIAALIAITLISGGIHSSDNPELEKLSPALDTISGLVYLMPSEDSKPKKPKPGSKSSKKK